MTNVHDHLDKALENAQHAFDAGAMGRAEKANQAAIASLADAIRELAPKPKAKAAAKAKDDDAPAAKKAPAKKVPAKKAASK